VGIAGSYKVLGKASQAVYDERLQRLGADIASVEHMSAAEKRARLEAGLGRLAAAIDAEGGQGGHVVGDSITFADIAVAAFIEFFRVCTDEGEHILTLNGGRWKKLLDQIKS
jgi:glutathione S-transferase